MKHTFAILLATFLFSFYSQAQKQSLRLSIEKAKRDSVRNLVFYPNSQLRIKTIEGDKFKVFYYSLSEDYIFVQSKNTSGKSRKFGYSDFSEAHVTDSIALSDINWIKGRVFKDGGRKFLGGGMVVVGTTGLILPVAIAAAGSVGAAVVVTIPVVGLVVAGADLMQARKFKVQSGWKVKTRH